MGLRFDLASANWLAWFLDYYPSKNLPDVSGGERIILESFLMGLKDGDFLSSGNSEYELREYVEYALGGGLTAHPFHRIRRFLSDRPWTALIIPSFEESLANLRLCSRDFLRGLVSIRPDDPGLILQLKELPKSHFDLSNVFPAFENALENITSWPGLLVWSGKRLSKYEKDSIFIPINTDGDGWEKQFAKVFESLAYFGFNSRELSKFVLPKDRRHHIIQLSDLHIGCEEARVRLPRVQSLARTMAESLTDSGKVTLAVTGDILDDPNEDYLATSRLFVDSLSQICKTPPIITIGNHDIRKSGILFTDYSQFIQLPATSRIIWDSDTKVAFVSFNSAIAGEWAGGEIGESQLGDIGGEIDLKSDWKEYSLVAIVHHHPTPVQRPEWQQLALKERILGNWFESTVVLKDAEKFMSFLSSRRFVAVLHGHKHIPRATIVDDVAVIGCGSSVGKIATNNSKTVMSINHVAIDTERRQLSCRLMVESTVGAGPSEYAEIFHHKF